MTDIAFGLLENCRMLHINMRQDLAHILSILLYFMQKYLFKHYLMRKQYRKWYYNSVIVGALYSYTIIALIFLVIFQVDSLLTTAWNTLAFTKFWKSGLAKYVCTNSVFSSNIAATMLMMSSLNIICAICLSPLRTAFAKSTLVAMRAGSSSIWRCTSSRFFHSMLPYRWSPLQCLTRHPFQTVAYCHQFLQE